ncbi:hypothetical protein NKH33_30240, partial [Mesorhizobium sp. M1182]|uniref:hypothetical protein n=1 Tax=Mesorhizobium sp. M1182 TaxID=2957067 RepID=UPI00333D3C5F
SSKALDLNMPNREVLQDCCNPDFFNTIGRIAKFPAALANVPRWRMVPFRNRVDGGQDRQSTWDHVATKFERRVTGK